MTHHKPNSLPLLNAGMETGTGTSTGTSPVLDVRYLPVALHYPSMFGNPVGQMCIAQRWSTAFTLTCLEIDAFLGQNPFGFHWCQLDIESGQPRWDWALGQEYNLQVLVTGSVPHPQVMMAYPDADPLGAKRMVIRAIVERGMRRAAFFNLDADNTGELQ